MFGQLGGNVVGILLDKCHERVELVAVQLGGGDPRWLAFERGLAAGGGENLRVSIRINDGDLLLRLIQGVNQFKPKVVFGRENAQPFARTEPHLGGISTEETWTTNHGSRNDRIVLAEVMSFDAVAPSA